MGKFIVITGGARSGKSTFAERLAKHYAPAPDFNVLYIATAQIFDEEMAERVQKHRQQRPTTWRVIEEPNDIERVLQQNGNQHQVILLDCVTVWLSNLLLAGLSDQDQDHLNARRVEAYPDLEAVILNRVKTLGEIAAKSQSTIIFVTNEVGQGIVPDSMLGRLYRDLAGKCNQLLAQIADQVYLVVAGYPLDVKQAGLQTFERLGMTRS